MSPCAIIVYDLFASNVGVIFSATGGVVAAALAGRTEAWCAPAGTSTYPATALYAKLGIDGAVAPSIYTATVAAAGSGEAWITRTWACAAGAAGWVSAADADPPSASDPAPLAGVAPPVVLVDAALPPLVPSVAVLDVGSVLLEPPHPASAPMQTDAAI
jgi:hypothetical protein